eukprot:scaffold75663_cov31-Tisochrysis_lutea.AAC.4
MLSVRSFGRSSLTPIFSISSVDGTGVPLLRQFFNLMPGRRAWANEVRNGALVRCAPGNTYAR